MALSSAIPPSFCSQYRSNHATTRLKNETEIVTQDIARSLLKYNPKTGVITWRRTINNIKAGSIAGCHTEYGYIRIMINGRNYLAHRIAWLLVYGYFPPGILDHKDGNGKNNSIYNLRLITPRGNMENRIKKSKNNTTGLMGVSLSRNKTGAKFRASIVVKGKQQYLGAYVSKEEAHDAYISAKKMLHQSFISPPL